MIRRDGHYILTLDDWNVILKHFMLSPRTIMIKEAPDLLFTEYQARDIYTKKIVLCFYDHDGQIRIFGKKNRFEYEIDISKILSKNPEPPSQQILNAIKANTRNSKIATIKNAKNKITEKLSVQDDK